MAGEIRDVDDVEVGLAGDVDRGIDEEVVAVVRTGAARAARIQADRCVGKRARLVGVGARRRRTGGRSRRRRQYRRRGRARHGRGPVGPTGVAARRRAASPSGMGVSAGRKAAARLVPTPASNASARGDSKRESAATVQRPLRLRHSAYAARRERRTAAERGAFAVERGEPETVGARSRASAKRAAGARSRPAPAGTRPRSGWRSSTAQRFWAFA